VSPLSLSIYNIYNIYVLYMYYIYVCVCVCLERRHFIYIPRDVSLRKCHCRMMGGNGFV